jgi:hypothetical protein
LTNQLKDCFYATKEFFQKAPSAPDNQRRAIICEYWFVHGLTKILWASIFDTMTDLLLLNHPITVQYGSFLVPKEGAISTNYPIVVKRKGGN